MRPQLRLGQELTGTVAWMTRPGATGIGVDLDPAAGHPAAAAFRVLRASFFTGRQNARG
jgi:hypothetical protein